jgi:hypothetical protein
MEGTPTVGSGGKPPKASTTGAAAKPAKKNGSTAKSGKPTKKLKTNPEIKPPSRAKTAYLFFCDNHRKKIRLKFPELQMTEVTKRLGDMWKKVSDTERAECVKNAEKDQERHRKEQQEYFKKLKQQAPLTAMLPSPSMAMQSMVPMVQTNQMVAHQQQVMAHQPQQKKPRKPRIPPSDFQLFERKLRKELKDNFKKEEVQGKWDALSEGEKEVHTTQAAEERKAYDEKMQQYTLSKQQALGGQGGPNTRANPVAFQPPVVTKPFVGPDGAEVGPGGIPVNFQQPLLTPTQLMDMDGLRKSLKRIAVDDAYYRIIDCLRPENQPIFHHACSAAHTFIIGKKRPDLKGFLITLFGMDEYENKLVKKSKKAPAASPSKTYK